MCSNWQINLYNTLRSHLQQKLDNILNVPHVVLCKVFNIHSFLQVFSELQKETRFIFHSTKNINGKPHMSYFETHCLLANSLTKAPRDPLSARCISLERNICRYTSALHLFCFLPPTNRFCLDIQLKKTKLGGTLFN